MKTPVTMEQAAQIEAAKQAAVMPAAVRKQVQREALASQQVDLSKYYYSRIRFQADAFAQNVMTFNPTERYAFGYGLREEVDGHPGHRSSYADTNLLEQRTTNNGEKVRIVGIGIRFTTLSDTVLASLFDMVMAVSLRMGDTEILHLGTPSDVPGSAQMSPGPTWVQASDSQSRVPPLYYPARKGLEQMENLLVLGEPILWTPSGNDQKMDVRFHLTVPVDFQPDAVRNATNPMVDANYVTYYTPPQDIGDPGTFVDYFVKLYVETTGPRSVNQ